MARALPFRRWIPLLAAPVLLVAFTVTAQAAQPAVGLGTAGSFAVLGGSTVTNTGPSVIEGDLGVSPGSAVTGFPPGLVNGAVHAADAVGLQAKSDLTVAYDGCGRTDPARPPAGRPRRPLPDAWRLPGAHRRCC